jgi:hypothetical protein
VAELTARRERYAGRSEEQVVADQEYHAALRKSQAEAKALAGHEYKGHTEVMRAMSGDRLYAGYSIFATKPA